MEPQESTPREFFPKIDIEGMERKMDQRFQELIKAIHEVRDEIRALREDRA